MSGFPGTVVPQDNFLASPAPSGSGRLEELLARQQALLQELDAVNSEIAEIKNGGVKQPPIRVLFSSPTSRPGGRMSDAEYENRFGMPRPTITMIEEVKPEEMGFAFGRD